jgi:hypothetical protein
MTDRINRTSICCIVFLDIIDYSKKTDSEQIAVKNQFNDLINTSLKDIAQNDRIILDTGDGAAIASMGSPEDALFMAMNIRDGILKGNIHSPAPLYVRFGINLGPVRVVNDINGQPNIIGDGINVAQRIMSFAKANEILVSRSYYEITSRLTEEISRMFDYSGIKHDKHVREHEVYTVRTAEDQALAKDKPVILRGNFKSSVSTLFLNKISWRYIAPSLLLVLLTLIKTNTTVFEFKPFVVDTVVAESAIDKAVLPVPVLSTANGLLPNETAENLSVEELKLTHENSVGKETKVTLPEAINVNGQDDALMQKKVAQDALAKTKDVKKEPNKKPKQKAAIKASDANPPSDTAIIVNTAAEQSAKVAELNSENNKEKSGWKILTDSIKQGQENKCSQAQIAMGQCQR